MVQIRKARRSATKLRLLLTGPSGSGKTWGGLQIAKGLGGKCVVIDTEEGSSDLYDHLHDFDVIDLKPPFTPERYIEAITAAEEAGYEVIIVDSVTHCWSGPGGCLELLEDVAKAQFRGNTWSAFSVITPRWRAFVDKLLRSPAHVICSGRSKTETAQVDDHGRKKVAKLGMKLEARDGLEFEFTLVLDLIHDGHYATVSKDRTGLFAGDPKPITAETGKRIAEWLAGGQAVDVTDDQGVVEKATDAIIDATTTTRLDAIVAGIRDRLAQKRITDATAARLYRMAAEKKTEIESDSNTPAVTA
jgi:hypothetical protein